MERAPLFIKTEKNTPRSETFAIEVTGYDLDATPHLAIGIRIDTGEEVAVFLRDVDYKKGRFKRSEVADFAAPRKDRQHPGTVIGGTLLAQEAIAQGDGVFGARWLQSLSHTPGEAEVFIAMIHVSPVQQGAGQRDYSLMTLLHDFSCSHLSEEVGLAMKIVPPFKVDSIDELKSATLGLLNDGIGVGVRVSTADNFDALYVGPRKGQTAQQICDNFMSNIAGMADAINSGSLTCEVIPYGNVWAGPSTVETMVKNPVMQSRVARLNEVEVDGNGKSRPVPVYRPAIVAVRLTRPSPEGKRAVFFTHFEPLMTREPVRGLVNAIAYAKTEHIAPLPPRMDRTGPANEAPAPASGPDADAPAQGAAGGEFDAGFDTGFPAAEFTDDDVVGAVDSFSIGEDAPPEAPAEQRSAPAPRRYRTQRA